MSSTTFSAATILSSILPSVCKIALTIPKSERGAFWLVVGLFGWKGWVVVSIILLVWGVLEMTLRFGHSANGCTRLFNVVVGSFTFTVFTSLVYLFFDKLFGDAIYCTLWPYPFHAFVFPAVWLFLFGIGFWVY